MAGLGVGMAGVKVRVGEGGKVGEGGIAVEVTIGGTTVAEGKSVGGTGEPVWLAAGERGRSGRFWAAGVLVGAVVGETASGEVTTASVTPVGSGGEPAGPGRLQASAESIRSAVARKGM